LKVEEVKKPELDAVLVARSIARQIEKRVSYRRAMKQAVARAMKAGAKGIMIQCKGRLAGAEMARKEVIKEGRIPRNTLRADIDYALAEALTILGKIGVKVWIYKGDLLPKKPEFEAFLVTEEATASE
jgi:small subunit ribosomal protein S3